MRLTRDDVRKVSLLARLILDEAELDTMTAQLGQIVTYVDQLSEVDTDEIEPLAHALDVANVFADDRPRAGLDRDRALAAAPHHDRECYLVPAVLGD